MKRFILNFTSGIIISILMLSVSFASTEFYLLTKDIQEKLTCNYLEIDNNQIICTDNALTTSYNLERIISLEVKHDGKLFQIDHFTPEVIRNINQVNSNKINSEMLSQQEKRKQAIYASWMPDIVQELSFESFSDFFESLRTVGKHQVESSIFNVVLLGSGLILVLVGNVGFLIATFRTGILWGLSCMIFPFVSLAFLLVHWKAAAKPFSTSLLGVIIVFLGTLLSSADGGFANSKLSRSSGQASQSSIAGRYECSGKKYCSEMSSCAEATFYIRNCPGTKMDGDGDGVPCERQWCN